MVLQLKMQTPGYVPTADQPATPNDLAYLQPGMLGWMMRSINSPNHGANCPIFIGARNPGDCHSVENPRGRTMGETP